MKNDAGYPLIHFFNFLKIIVALIRSSVLVRFSNFNRGPLIKKVVDLSTFGSISDMRIKTKKVRFIQRFCTQCPFLGGTQCFWCPMTTRLQGGRMAQIVLLKNLNLFNSENEFFLHQNAALYHPSINF